jgi:benzodiazapine receptor
VNAFPRWAPVLWGAAAAMLVAAAGAAVTDLGPWYQALKQPAWKPPDWLFGPAWTVIFACTALAGASAWAAAPGRAVRTRLLWLFGLNGLLNVLWSLLFFRMQRPDWALVEVVFLWLSILVLVLAVSPYSRPAAALLAPYLAWVTFAAALNYAVVQLNKPFLSA